MTIKLSKWEIMRLLAKLDEPASKRWKVCPFGNLATGQHCAEICGKWFPKIAEGIYCPNACERPSYTSLEITRIVKKHLREQGVEV